MRGCGQPHSSVTAPLLFLAARNSLTYQFTPTITTALLLLRTTYQFTPTNTTALLLLLHISTSTPSTDDNCIATTATVMQPIMQNGMQLQADAELLQ